MKLNFSIPKHTFIPIAIGLCLGILLSPSVPDYAVRLFLFITLFLVSIFLIVPTRSSKLGLVCLVFLFISIGIQSFSVRQKPANGAVFELLYTKGDVVQATVLERAQNSDKSWNKALLEVKYLLRDGEKIQVNQTIFTLLNSDEIDIKKGDFIEVVADLFPIENKRNPGEFDAKKYWKSKGIKYMMFLTSSDEYHTIHSEVTWLFRIFNALDRSLSELFEKNLDPEAVGIAKALVLGDRDHLASETVRSFGNAGAMHVLAVSGLHVGLILALLLFVFKQFPTKISKYQATFISLLILWFYALLTGFSASVFRAVVMFSMLAIGRISSRSYDSLNVLAASAVVLLIYDSFLLFDLGFQLSYLAMFGILTLQQPIAQLWFIENKIGKWLWDGVSVALAAQVFTLPLTLYCFHQFPNYFLLTNLGLMLITNIVLILGIVFIVIQFIPFLSILVAFGLSISVLAMFYFVQWVDRLPGSTAKGFVFSEFQLWMFYAVFLIILFFLNSQKGKWIAYVCIVGVSVLLAGQRYTQLNKQELVVFNDNHFALCLNTNNGLHCFYESEEHFDKTVYLVENYEKLHPNPIFYHRLADEKIQLSSTEFSFSISPNKTFFDVDMNGEKFSIIKNFTFENNAQKDVKMIFMPWLDIKEKASHSLKQGAFIRPF